MSKKEQISKYTERARPSFVNESGMTVHVKPIEMDAAELMEVGIKEDYRAAGKPVDPPEVEVVLAGGQKVKRPLTEKNLVVEGSDEETARRQELWNAHQEALNEMKLELGNLTIEYILDGVDEELPEDDSWTRRFERRHIKVPTDPYDRLIFYKKHVLIITPGDYARMQGEVAMVSSSGTIERKEVEATVASFLDRAKLRVKKMGSERIKKEAAEGPVAA